MGNEEQDPTDATESTDDLGLDQFGEVSDDQGISLEDLSSAYAEMMGGEDPYEEGSSPEGPAESELESMILAEEEDEDEDDEGVDVTPLGILEAMLFVGDPENDPLTSRRVASLMRGVPPGEIDDMVVELNEIYTQEGRPYEVVSEGAGYRLVLRREYAQLRSAFYGKVREARLSQAAIDVLAIVAYHPGTTKPEIDELRGKPSGAVLSQMVRRSLLRLERPEKKPRKPQYYPTDRFLELFGLHSLDELPRSES